MLYVFCFLLDLFTNGVFLHLYVTESLSGHVVGPLHTCCVVIIYGGGASVESVEKVEVF